MLHGSTLFLSLFLLTACSADTAHFTIGVSAEEPGPRIAEETRLLLVDSGLSAEVRSIEVAADIISAVLSGDIDFGIIAEPAVLIPGLTTVLPLYPSILHVLYKSENTPASFADVLVGKRIYAGPLGGPTSKFLAQLGDYFDIDADSYTVLGNPWVEVPDVYFVFGGLLDINSRRKLAGYRLFSFGDADRLGKGTLGEGITLQMPNVDTFVLPEQVYGNLNRDAVLTLATRTVLVTAASTSVERVFDLTSILLANSQRLSVAYPLVKQAMNENIRLSSFTLPVHAGAQRSLEKDAPTVIQRYAQVIALGLTLSAMFGSALVALYKSRKTRKKARIDVYYNKILDLRHALQETVTEEYRHSIEEQIKSVQNEVFALLVDERVSANESLTIFLELSNKVLDEAQHYRAAKS